MGYFGGYNIPKLGPFFRHFKASGLVVRESLFQAAEPVVRGGFFEAADLAVGGTISRLADLTVGGKLFQGAGPAVRAITRTLKDWPCGRARCARACGR